MIEEGKEPSFSEETVRHCYLNGFHVRHDPRACSRCGNRASVLVAEFLKAGAPIRFFSPTDVTYAAVYGVVALINKAPIRTRPKYFSTGL